MVKIIRFGEKEVLPVSEIVVGDIIILEAGDEILVDGLGLEFDELTVDESAMTGEVE